MSHVKQRVIFDQITSASGGDLYALDSKGFIWLRYFAGSDAGFSWIKINSPEEEVLPKEPIKPTPTPAERKD